MSSRTDNVNRSRRKSRQVSVVNLGDYLLSKNDKLGKGSYSEVYKGYSTKDPTLIFAIKVIIRETLKRALISSLENEIKTLQKLNSDYIIKLHDVQKSKRHYYLIMEYAGGGDLMDLIKAKGKLREPVARRFLFHLALGLKTLRKFNFVHRDLKPQNLLLTSADEGATLKIGDFGFARELLQDNMAETIVGTPLYMAPEILMQQKYDYKADMWSVGAILYEMLTGTPPFVAQTMYHLVSYFKEKKISVDYPSILSEEAIHLMKGLLQQEQDKRIDFETFFNHPFLEEERVRWLSQQQDIETRQSASQHEDEMTAEEYSPTKRIEAQTYDDKIHTDTQPTETAMETTPIAIKREEKIITDVSTPSPSSSSMQGSSYLKQAKVNPFIEADLQTSIGQHNISSDTPASSSRDDHINLDSYDMIDSEMTLGLPHTEKKKKTKQESLLDQTLDSHLTISEFKDVRFTWPAFDFGQFHVHPHHHDASSRLERLVQRAWVVAEAAFLNDRFGQHLESLVMYNISLSLLFDAFEMGLPLTSTSPLSDDKVAAESPSERILVLMHWMKEHYVSIADAAQQVRNKVALESNDRYVCPEAILYSYGLKLAKTSSLEEYLANADHDNCKAMYIRARIIFETLLERGNPKFISEQSDREIIDKCATVLLWTFTNSVYAQSDGGSNVTSYDNFFPIHWNSVPYADKRSITEFSSGFGNCSCNIIAGACDANCCCDTDCSSEEFSLFAYCLPHTAKDGINEKKCVPSSNVMIDNLPSGLVGTIEISNPDPLFCVYFDRSPTEGSFYTRIDDLSENEITTIVSRQQAMPNRGLDSFGEQFDKQNKSSNTETGYVVGDLIPIALTGTLERTSPEYLLLPSGAISSECMGNSFVQFLKWQEGVSCQIPLSSFESACAGALNVITFVDKWVVSKVPQPASDSDFSINIIPRKTTLLSFSGGVLVPETVSNPTPTIYTEGTPNICSNALKELTYYVRYDNNQISSVEVDVTLQETLEEPIDQFGFEQTFRTVFLNSTQSPEELETGTVIKTSGRPGYLRGYPVLAGNRESFVDKEAILQSKPGIKMYTGLNCEQRDAQSISFDRNAVVACRMQLTEAELANACTSTFDFDAFKESENLTHVGRYGNADFKYLDDWVQIQTETKSSPTWNSASRICYDTPSVIQYDFIIAKSGSVLDEQWKIVGVHRYRVGQTWTFDRSATVNSFYLQWRVRFIRHPSQSAARRLAPIPNFLPTLPMDVLYPFTIIISAGSPFHYVNYWMTVACIVIVIASQKLLVR